MLSKKGIGLFETAYNWLKSYIYSIFYIIITIIINELPFKKYVGRMLARCWQNVVKCWQNSIKCWQNLILSFCQQKQQKRNILPTICNILPTMFFLFKLLSSKIISLEI
jgi:hypothetical protein